MTEDEAATVQCCGPEGCGYFNEEPRPARWCVGSKCMAWRTRREDYRYNEHGGLASGPRVISYCGLAGTP